MPRRTLSPRTYRIEADRTVSIGGLARIDVVDIEVSPAAPRIAGAIPAPASPRPRPKPIAYPSAPMHTQTYPTLPKRSLPNPSYMN